MKKRVVFAIALVTGVYAAQAQDAVKGEATFKKNCSACHSVGEGKRVGPDLKGVGTRHKEAWIIKFVKGSQTMVKAGDAEAVKVFNDNNKIPMPDQKLTDAEIKDVMAYVKKKGAAK